MADATLGELAQAIGAELAGGEPGTVVSGLAGLSEAGPDDLSFLANRSYRDQLTSCRAGAVVVSRDIDSAPVPLLKTDNPDLAFAKASMIIHPPSPLPPPGIHPTAVIHEKASIGDKVSIGPWTVIEEGAVIGDNSVLMAQIYVGRDVQLGADCLVYPSVTFYPGITIGDRCIFHAGSVIGSDGFGYAWTGQGYFKIPQVGTVIIENDVEIGAGTCIDRARFGETRVGAGTKLDNLIQVGHNVKIGPLCAFAAQVGLAGSSQVGAGVQMGGQVGLAGHIRLGDGLSIAGQSGVSKSIPGREAGVSKEQLAWIGSPAKPIQDQLKEWQNVKSLGRLRKTVRELESRIAELEAGTNGGE